MAYEADRWRDRSIIGQCSLKAAVDLMSVIVVPEGGDVLTTVKYLQTELYQHTLEMIGADDQRPKGISNSARGGNSIPSQRPAGAAPYGGTKLTFGKYKGMTIAEADAAVGDDGKTGRSWLEWLRDNTDNEFMRKAATAYLDATALGSGTTS